MVGQIEVMDEDEQIPDPEAFMKNCAAALQPLATGTVVIRVDEILYFDDDCGT